jgi:hypothetical protein
MTEMKKLIVFLLAFVSLFILITGCTGPITDPGANPTPTPSTGHTYTMSFSVSGEIGESSVALNKNMFTINSIPQTSDWWEAREEVDFLSGIKPYYGSNPTGVQVWIRDEFGELIDMTAEDAELYITWTSPDEDYFDLFPGDLNMTGYGVSFNPLVSKVYSFTATFFNSTYSPDPITKTCYVAVLNTPKIDPFAIDATFKAGYILSTGTATDIAGDWDITYQHIGDSNYIIAPYGIEKVCEAGNDGIDEGISTKQLGSILQNPTGLTFTNTQAICENATYYIIKTKNGGYAKFLNTFTPTSPINRTVTFMYEYSATGVYQLHWVAEE